MQIGLGISAVRTHLGFTDVQTSVDPYGKSPLMMLRIDQKVLFHPTLSFALFTFRCMSGSSESRHKGLETLSPPVSSSTSRQTHVDPAFTAQHAVSNEGRDNTEQELPAEGGLIWPLLLVATVFLSFAALCLFPQAITVTSQAVSSLNENYIEFCP